MEVNVIIDGQFQDCPGEAWFRDTLEQALKALDIGADTEVGLVVTGQEKIKELNRTYRGEDSPTDVLAFFMTETGAGDGSFVAPPDGVLHLGEIIISCPQAVLQAEERRHPVQTELAVLIVHGALHLLGYDHEAPEDERRMKEREGFVLNRILRTEETNYG